MDLIIVILFQRVKKIDNFDEYDIEALAKYVLDMSKRELTEEEKVYQKYEREIRKVQLEYDETKNSDCNSKMIKIAEKYNTLLSDTKIEIDYQKDYYMY